MARLGDICRFQSGGTPAKSEPLYFNGTIPWITTVALNGKHINEKNAVDWITEKAINNSAAKIVPPHSIMIGTRVGVGKVAINDVPMSTSQDIVSLIGIDEEKWNKDYICKFILSQNSYLDSQSRGATIKGIKIETIADLSIPDITMDQQAKIFAVIEKTDQLISLRKVQLEKLDDLVKARFVEMFGQEHRRMSMQDICGIITDGTHQPPKFVPDGIPFIFVSNITNNKVTYDAEKYIDQATYDELIKRTPIQIGDILLSTVGSYGHPAVVKSDKKFLFQRHIAYLKPDHNIVDSDYLHGAILSPDAQRQIEESVKGIAQKTLNLSEIKKITVPIPPMTEQRLFSAFISQVDKSKLFIQQGLEKLETLKKSLMQQYFG